MTNRIIPLQQLFMTFPNFYLSNFSRHSSTSTQSQILNSAPSNGSTVRIARPRLPFHEISSNHFLLFIVHSMHSGGSVGLRTTLNRACAILLVLYASSSEFTYIGYYSLFCCFCSLDEYVLIVPSSVDHPNIFPFLSCDI